MFHRLRASAALALSLFAMLILSPSPALSRADDTDHIREFAKNKKVRVAIIVSGTQAASYGEALRTAIQRHSEYGKRKPDEVVVLTLKDAEGTLARPEFARTSAVFLFTGKDLAATPLPPTVASLLPFDSALVKTRASIVKSGGNRMKAGAPVYTVALSAPDGLRLGRLYERFLARRAHFKALPFEETYITNRVALFSAPQNQDACQRWGHLKGENIWNEVQWYPLSEREKMTPEQLEECAEVYFLDRSVADAVIPEPAARLLEGQTIQPTTILINRTGVSGGADGRLIAAFSAPSAALLRRRAALYPDLKTLPDGMKIEDVADLRNIGATTLRVTGASPTDAAKEQVRLALAKELRDRLGIQVRERGASLKEAESEVQLQDLLGATDTAKKNRSKVGVRYLWLFTITDYIGSTNYESKVRKITPEPAAFKEQEPILPSIYNGLFNPKKKPQEQIDREKREFDVAKSNWDQKKANYESEMRHQAPVDWERIADRIGTARVRGILQLVDLNDVGKVIWEKEGVFTATERANYRRETTRLRGHENKPDPINTPPSAEGCAPPLMYQAALTAGRQAVDFLQAEALLPARGSRPIPGPDDGDEDKPVRVAAGGQPKIADISEGIITLTIGAKHGVRVGEKIIVPTKTRNLTDPDTGKILSVKVLASVTLIVRAVEENVCECAPATPQDSAKMAQMRVGMVVKRVAPTAPARPRVAR